MRTSMLLKGNLSNQELKTKWTTLKPLIIILSLSVLSFIADQYLPYVITGSGAIAAVPLTIFAASTVVALASVIYLVKLTISIANDKKKVGLSREESGQRTASQESQNLVCENCTNLKSEPIGVKQDSGSQTNIQGYGTPKEQLQKDQNGNGTSKQLPAAPETHGTVAFSKQQTNGAPPPPPPPPPSFQNSSTQSSSTGLFAEMGNVKLRPKGKVNGDANQGDNRSALFADIIKAGGNPLRQGGGKASGEKKEELNNDKGRLSGGLMDDLKETLKNRRRGIIGEQRSSVQQLDVEHNSVPTDPQNTDQGHEKTNPVQGSNDTGFAANALLGRINELYPQSSTLQPDEKKGTSTTDSGYGSGDDWPTEDQDPVGQASSGTPVGTEEQNSLGNAGSSTNEKNNESGFIKEPVQAEQNSDAENESKERAERIEKALAERKKNQEERQKKSNNPFASIRKKSDTENKPSNSDNGNECLILPNSQPDSKKRSGSFDSGYKSDDGADRQDTALPSHQSNTEKPPILPKPANLQTGPQAPPAEKESGTDPVNSEVKDPSAFSVKDRIAQFGEKASRHQKENVVLRS